MARLNRHSRGALEAALTVVLVLLAAVLATRLAARHPVRLDLTGDHRNTLSETTRDLLARVEGPLEIRAFLPTHLPPPYSTVVRRMTDLLEACAEAGVAEVRLSVVDPTDDALSPEARAALRAEAEGLGVGEAELQVRRDDRQRLERVVFGVALLNGARQAVVPPVNHPDQLEYLLAKALQSVVAPQARRPRIGVSEGHDEPPLLSSPLATVLGASAELVTVRLDGAALPPDLDALLIFAPRRRLGDRARWVVEQYLLRGGAVVSLLDHHAPSVAFPEVLVDAASGLEPLLAAQGLRLDPTEVVLDRVENAPAPMGRDASGRNLSAHHPAWLRTRALDDRHPITRSMGALVLPFAAPLHLTARAGLQVDRLVWPGPTAVVARGAHRSEPAAYGTPGTDERPATDVALAVAITGNFAATFAAGSAPPEAIHRPDDRPAPPDPPTLGAAQGEGRWVVVTSGARFLAAQESAVRWLQNALDWAVADTDLIALRNRTAGDPPLRPTTEATRAWVRYGNLFGAPLALILCGLLMARRRRRRAGEGRRAGERPRP